MEAIVRGHKPSKPQPAITIPSEWSSTESAPHVLVEAPPLRKRIHEDALVLPCAVEPPQLRVPPEMLRALWAGSDQRVVVVDFETTNFGDASIVEIGAVEVIGSSLTGAFFHQVVNPGKKCSPFATAVHGLSDECLACSPIIESVLPHFIRFAQSREEHPPVLVFHNALFDERILKGELLRAQISFQFETVCTLQLFRRLYPKQAANLESCCSFFGIQRQQRHNALHDAAASAHVLLRMKSAFSDLVDS